MENQKRKWSIQTQHTRSIGARLPNELYERLKSFCAQHGYTTTEAVCESLVKFMDSFEDSGKEDGGYLSEGKKIPRSGASASRGCLYGGELGI